MYKIQVEHLNRDTFDYWTDYLVITGKFWKHWKYYLVAWSFKPEHHRN